jgi:hypothetical protein
VFLYTNELGGRTNTAHPTMKRDNKHTHFSEENVEGILFFIALDDSLNA